MGALTLKSYPFELRGWDIEKLKSFDLTDGFGSNIRIYVAHNQIIQIESDYNHQTLNTWITDKGRQFFDGIFGVWSKKNNLKNSTELSKYSWQIIFNNLSKALYKFDILRVQNYQTNFFTIIFQDVSLEILGLLNIISKSYPFFKVLKSENHDINTDLESNFSLNLAHNKISLKQSSLCLLLATNTRYEGFTLNLSLRQRFLKGNFKCFSFGSLLNLTFPSAILGSNLNGVISICEGNHSACQDFSLAKNPIVIMNSEIFKRVDGKNISDLLKILKYSNILSKIWNSSNILNSSLYETGIYSQGNFKGVSLSDLTNFSSIYLLNVNVDKIKNLKRIAKSKLLCYVNNNNNNSNTLLLDHNFNAKLNSKFLDNFIKSKDNYMYLPVSMFYENNDTYVTTEGCKKNNETNI